MHRLVLGLSERNSISAGAARLMWLVFLLLCVSSAAVTSRGSSGERGSDTAIALQTGSAEARQAEIRELKQGQVIERELAGAETHTYRVELTSGQYLKVVVEQKGIDVTVRMVGPDGQKLTEADNDPAVGEESVFVVAESSADYRLEVRPSSKEAKTGRYAVSIEELREATSKDRVHVVAQNAVESANQLRDQQTAESRQKAIKKYEEALPLWRDGGDKKREAYTLNELGLINSGLGNSQKALEYYNKALTLWRAVRNPLNQASTLTNIGMVHWRLSELQKALEFYSEALPLRRAVGDRQGEAITLNNIGLAYTSLGQLQEGLKYYNLTLPLSRAVGHIRLESIVLNNIGAIYQRFGDLQKALEYYYLVLPLKRAIGDRRSEANTVNNIGTIYLYLGEPKKALEHYTQALVLSRDVGDRQGEAVTLDSLGMVYIKLGEPKKGLEYYDQALEISRAVKDRRQEAYILTHIGSAHQFSGEPRKALDYLNQSLSISRDVGDRIGEALSLSGIGRSYDVLSQPQKALEFYNKALRLSQEIGDRSGEANRLSEIAHVERKLGNLTEARVKIEATLNIIESTRIKVANQELRASYLAMKQDSYRFYIDLLMQLYKAQPSDGIAAAALQASERARARSLLDILTESRADIRQGLDAVLLERERSLQQQLNFKSERLTRLLGGKHTEEQAAAARKEVEVLLGEYHDIEAQIRTTSPRYAALTQPQPLSLKEIQHQVLDEDTLLLEYALSEDRSYLWAVTPTSIGSFELPGRAEIEAAARRVDDLLVAKADGLYTEALTALSQMLLKPVADQLGRKRLLIVSEGALQYVPFGALPEPSVRGTGARGREPGIRKNMSFKPLIVNHEIVSLPSASVLAILRRELGTRKPAAKTVAVLADPVFDKDDQRVNSKIRSLQADGPGEWQKETVNASLPSDVERSIKESGLDSFDRLVLSRREAESIIALASNGQPFKALDFTASRATATSPELDQYQIVHFATHSLLNNQHPELSGIVLSLVDEQGQPQDGFLRLHEIYNLKLNADLVVLSACQTALGKDTKGEGLVGLTRGFMYAGAPRVVASLWKVSDRATTELMKRFYQKLLRDGLRPAAALRAAQVSMLKEKQWEAAYYWAGFVLQGEWR